MKSRFLPIYILLAFLLAACGTNTAPTPTLPLPSPQASILTTPTRLPTYTPTAQPAAESFSHYNFDVHLDYAQHSLQASQTITYFNKQGFPLTELMLVIPPKAFPGVYTQTNLSSEFLAETVEDGIRTTLRLSQPLLPEQTTTISLEYKLNLPQREGAFGFTSRQINLSNWYPFFPPLDDAGNWISHDPMIDTANMVVGEYLVNEIADFSLNLVVSGASPNLKIASGAAATPIENGSTYQLKQARAIAFSLSDQFYFEELDHKGIKIQAYVFLNQRDKAQSITRIAAQAMDLFSELFGTYPREHIAIVSADFLHNMEMDGMVLLSNKIIDFYDETPLNNLTILIPHELSHQWFYSLVGNDQAEEPWLDESIATYSEALYYERYHPEYRQWWWDNRVYAHEHNGYVNNSIYQAASYDAYRASVYLNGAIFIEELRAALSDLQFFEGLKNYVSQNHLKIASQKDFFASLNPQDAVDLQPLLLKYFR